MMEGMISSSDPMEMVQLAITFLIILNSFTYFKSPFTGSVSSSSFWSEGLSSMFATD